MLTGDHSWRGDKEGSCPFCHQNLIQVIPGTDDVICPICGITGKVSVEDGKVGFVWPDDEEHRKDNRLELRGKLTHLHEVHDCLVAYRERMDEAKEKAQKYHDWKDIVLTPPSKIRKAEERAKKAAEAAAQKEQ